MGIFIALILIALWSGHLVYCFSVENFGWTTPLAYLHLLVQSYLTTGLFITAHDAMHGTVSRNRFLNDGIGRLSCVLFAGFSYGRLRVNHHKHHAAPTSETDPDFYIASQSFWRWLTAFALRYATLTQLVIMAATYNVFQHLLGVPEERIWMFWMLPSLLGTLQLFYFGTYVPHKLPHRTDAAPYFARSLQMNHAWAMISCYFFGYHLEHHRSPHSPWWMLWKVKEAQASELRVKNSNM